MEFENDILNLGDNQSAIFDIDFLYDSQRSQENSEFHSLRLKNLTRSTSHSTIPREEENEIVSVTENHSSGIAHLVENPPSSGPITSSYEFSISNEKKSEGDFSQIFCESSEEESQSGKAQKNQCGRGRKSAAKKEKSKNSEKKNQNVGNCPYKYVLRNTMTKFLKILEESTEMTQWMQAFCYENGLDFQKFEKKLTEEGAPLRRQLETRAGLAKFLNISKEVKGRFSKNSSKRFPKEDSELRLSNDDFRMTLRTMLESFIHDFSISYLAHSKITSEKGCYIQTFTTILKSLDDAQNLSSLKKEKVPSLKSSKTKIKK